MSYKEIERAKAELIAALKEAGLGGEKTTAAIEALIDAKVAQSEQANAEFRREVYGEI